MTPQLFSIEHAPVSLPIWQTMMDDLCNPPPARVARVLGISQRSVYRYNATGHAPRAVCLAIFWLTRWGRTAVHAQAVNDALVACSFVDGLRRQVQERDAQLAYVQSIGHFGSANDPSNDHPGSPRNARLT